MTDTPTHPKTLGDYFDLQRGASYKSMLLDAPGPVLLGLATIARDGGFRSDSLRTYSGDSPDRMLLRPGDLYVSLKDVTQSGDLLGSVARVPPEVPLGRLTQDTVKLIFRDANAPREYLYWVMRSPEYRQHCRAHSTGTTNLGLSREDFLGFPVPDLTPARKRVVDLLEAIEQRIVVNHKMGSAIESIARTLFKSWFVDFDPVRYNMRRREHAALGRAGRFISTADDLTISDPSGKVIHRGGDALYAPIAHLFPDRLVDSPLGEVPEGWRVGTLGEVASERRDGIAPEDILPGTAYIALEHMPRRCIALSEWSVADDVASGKLIFKAGDILFGKLRPYFHKVGVAPLDGVCSTDIIVMRAKSPEWAAFALGVASSDEFVAYTDRRSAGTKMPRTNWTDMAAYPIVAPPAPLAVAYNKVVTPMIARMIAGTHANRTLAALRDTLLPKLISGELRIADAEKIVERATHG